MAQALLLSRPWVALLLGVAVSTFSASRSTWLREKRDAHFHYGLCAFLLRFAVGASSSFLTRQSGPKIDTWSEVPTAILSVCLAMLISMLKLP